MPTSRIFVSHNAEIAHRLSLLPGKCQNIHGHSMDITMTIEGEIDENGILAGLDFATVKRLFRNYIDNLLDHHLHLNQDDEWAQQLWSDKKDEGTSLGVSNKMGSLPGLVMWPGDPTTENMAKWICEAMYHEFESYATSIHIAIQETNTNGAEYELP